MAAALGPGPTTSVPGLPAPRFGTRGSARCEGLAASAPRPGAPRCPGLSPLPQTQPLTITWPLYSQAVYDLPQRQTPPSLILFHLGVSYT